MTLATPNRTAHWVQWVAYGACAWAFLFAALSFYWALGGMVGVDTAVSPAIARLARAHDPLLFAGLWITALLKVFGGFVALALVQPWGRRVPSWLLLLLTWGGGTLAFVHGALYLVVGVLALSGAIQVGMSGTTLYWYTFLWGPWWLLGGILFLLAAWFYVRGLPRTRANLVFSLLGVLGALLLLILSGGTIG